MRSVATHLLLAIGLLASACGRSGTSEEAVLQDPPTDTTPEPEPPPQPQGGPRRAPIVLMHGMAGFESIGPAEYFFGVAEALESDGYDVHVAVVDPIQSVAVRAQQAAVQIDAILAGTGAEAVHLVGHSQGGLDARYVVSALGFGDRVATVTTIASPHRGTKLADLSLGLIPGDAQAAAAAVLDVLVGTATGTDADTMTIVNEITSKHMTEVFNPAVPDDPRVAYYSVAGSTQPWLAVNVFDTDVVDPLLWNAYWMTSSLEGDNDGLVPVESAKWGEFWGTLPADHFDEMGWWPTVPQPAFDHLAWYRSLARYLNGDGPIP